MARLWTIVLLTAAAVARAIPAGGARRGRAVAVRIRGGGEDGAPNGEGGAPNEKFAPYAQLFRQSGASPDAVEDLERAVAAGASNDECCEKVLAFKREQAMIAIGTPAHAAALALVAAEARQFLAAGVLSEACCARVVGEIADEGGLSADELDEEMERAADAKVAAMLARLEGDGFLAACSARILKMIPALENFRSQRAAGADLPPQVPGLAQLEMQLEMITALRDDPDALAEMHGEWLAKLRSAREQGAIEGFVALQRITPTVDFLHGPPAPA